MDVKVFTASGRLYEFTDVFSESYLNSGTVFSIMRRDEDGSLLRKDFPINMIESIEVQSIEV